MRQFGKIVVILSFVLLSFFSFRAEAKEAFPNAISSETADCVSCHQKKTVNIYQQWGKSRHFGANVGCYECHKADARDPDAFEHEGHVISVIVSPKDCARCHERETKEFAESHHSKGGRILGSLDNTLAEVVEGNQAFKTEAFPEGVSAAAVNGCWQCHGVEIKVLKDKDGKNTGKLDPATWPNTGIGRLNPDGSEGSCTACHQRHEFSLKQARQPENCGKCHMGPDHPQKEIYEESKHGINYYAHKDEMNLGSSKWVVGEDYFAAPTCATCHMSATRDLPVTHNVGLRIKWNNRPVHSKPSHLTDQKWGLPSASYTADQRRKDMEKVCSSCHAPSFTKNFFLQYEALIALYEEKFAIPGEKLYAAATKVLKASLGEKYAAFAQKIDYTWFELWHHEGRRARHAASMQGPDYTHWHGTYDLARNFYGEYVPQIKEIIREHRDGKAAAEAKELESLLQQVLESDDHKWSIGLSSKEEKAKREQRRKEFLERYK
ncbi:MAG: hydroxylamine oxidoreductase [Nitrospinae bacterium]|nr:hydroxylamine oxidoreductase [Nitrospinota bacterium]